MGKYEELVVMVSKGKALEQCWAKQVKRLLDKDYPDLGKVCQVMDNLDTHFMDSPYGSFTPEETNRLASRLERHFTLKHGSRLDMAECEFAFLKNQCHGTRWLPTMIFPQ